MERLFSPDGGFMHFLSKLSDICIISILWLMCCIPVVTIGASTTAAYYAMVKVVKKERGTLLREFWSCFKRNLKDSIIINAIYLLIVGILVFNIYSMYQQIGNPQNSMAFQMLFIYVALLFVMLALCIYTYPVLSRFEMKKTALVKFSVMIMFRHFFITLLLLAVFMLSFIAILVFPLVAILVPGVCLYLYSFFMEKILRKYMSEEMLEAWDGEAEENQEIA